MCNTPAETGRVSAMLDRAANQLSATRDALIRAGDVYAPARGKITLAQPLMRGIAPQQYHATEEGKPGLPTLAEMASRRDSWTSARRSTPQLTAAQIRALSTPPAPASGSVHSHQPPHKPPMTP